MIQGFKDFIARGNVIDLAVAVVIGTAFGAVVTAIVDGIVTPLIAALGNTDNLAALTLQVGPITFGWGLVVGALIKFLAIALVVYLALVMPMNKWRERQAAKAGPGEPSPETEQELLVQIRDLLAKQDAANGTKPTAP